MMMSKRISFLTVAYALSWFLAYIITFQSFALGKVFEYFFSTWSNVFNGRFNFAFNFSWLIFFVLIVIGILWSKRQSLGLKKFCAVLGFLHAAVMTFFALGPELSPLTVYLVDYPIAYVLSSVLNLSETIWLYGSIVICSIAYPWLLFLILKTFSKGRSAAT